METTTQANPLGTVSTRQTRTATKIAFLAWTIAVYDFILFGTMLPRIEESFGWSESHALLISTLVSIGTCVVVLAVGPMVDKVGRRKGMIISVGGTAASSAATALAQNAATLVGVRAISGLGLAEQSVNATYLNELYALTEDEKIKRNQGFVYSMVQTGWPLGALLAAAFVGAVAKIAGEDSWRITFLLATIPAVIVALVCLRLKESPQFVMHAKISALRKSDKNEEAHALAKSVGIEINEGTAFKRIFTGKNLRTTLVFSLAWLVNWIGLQIFSVLGTSVLEKGKGIASTDALILVVVSNIVGALGYLTHGYLGDRFGRKRVIVCGWMASGIIFAVMLIGPSNTAFVLVTYMLGLFFMLGPYAAILFYQAECYDTDCRATASTFIGAMSQPGAIIGGFALTGLVAAGVAFGTAALWVGATGVFLSGVIMLGARSIKQEYPTGPPLTQHDREVAEHVQH
jgi:MFS transporter, putative metabolite:H+ symporter